MRNIKKIHLNDETFNLVDYRLDKYVVSLREFGAVGDGVTDDTDAVREFFNACIGGVVGFIPAGIYLVTQQIVITEPIDAVRSLVVYGSGAYKSIIKSTYGGSPCFLFETVADDAYHIVFSDFGFEGDTAGTLFSLGDLSDAHPIGNCNFTNMFFNNKNTNKGSSAITALFNYIFDSVFTNCVFVGNPSDRGYGVALSLRACVFCNFVGGSYSNAYTGILFPSNAFTHTCNFTCIDLENVEYGIRCEGSIVHDINVDTAYFDIWHPLLPTPSLGEYAISVTACGIGGIKIKNAFYSRVTTPYGKGGLDPVNRQNTYVGECDWCYHSVYSGTIDQVALPLGFWSNVKFIIKTTLDGAEFRSVVVINHKEIENLGTVWKYYICGGKNFEYRLAVNETATTLNYGTYFDQDVKANTVVEIYTQR